MNKEILIILFVKLILIHADSYLPPVTSESYGVRTNFIKPNPYPDREWELFKATYNKTFLTPEVEKVRRNIFYENRNNVNYLNDLYAKGKLSFTSKINAYSDLTFHEFTHKLNGLKSLRKKVQPYGYGAKADLTSDTDENPAENYGSYYIAPANVLVPAAIDWRELGAVTPIKNQGNCASCYAFASVGAIEGQHYRKTGKLLDMSPQQIVECSKDQGNDGCESGTIFDTFEYCKNGLNSESSYPYTAKDNGQCRFKPNNIAEKCTGFTKIAEGDERGLQVALATKGPISVSFSVTPEFMHYNDGIFDVQTCRETDINHAMLLVGYGEENDGKKYWLLKNSYGTKWGAGGYIKVARDVNDLCKLTEQAAFPHL